MSGIVVALVAVGFLILMVLIAVAIIPDLFGSLFDDLNEFYTATKLKPRVGVDEVVCDLRIKVNAQMTQDVNLGIPLIDSEPRITIDPFKSHDYNWYNCKFASQYTPFDLINEGGVDEIQQDTFILTYNGALITKIAIIDAIDSTQRVDSALQNQLEKQILFNTFQAYNTPYDVSVEYVISDIPVRDYRLQIFYDADFIQGINRLPQGSPFEAQICDENKVLVSGQCRFP